VKDTLIRLCQAQPGGDLAAGLAEATIVPVPE
jgi:hypothetical protein